VGNILKVRAVTRCRGRTLLHGVDVVGLAVLRHYDQEISSLEASVSYKLFPRFRNPAQQPYYHNMFRQFFGHHQVNTTVYQRSFELQTILLLIWAHIYNNCSGG
jgi:hypothetical protein